MLKIIVCCANGAGTSMMMKLSAEKMIKSLDLKVAKLHHCAISEAVSSAINYDVVFCPITFIASFKSAQEKGVHVIGLKNVLSPQEMEEKLKETGLV